MIESPVVGKLPRHRIKANKRRHKALRIKALMKERKAEAKDTKNLDRVIGRSAARAEAAFRGCDVR